VAAEGMLLRACWRQNRHPPTAPGLRLDAKYLEVFFSSKALGSGAAMRRFGCAVRSRGGTVSRRVARVWGMCTRRGLFDTTTQYQSRNVLGALRTATQKIRKFQPTLGIDNSQDVSTRRQPLVAAVGTAIEPELAAKSMKNSPVEATSLQQQLLQIKPSSRSENIDPPHWRLCRVTYAQSDCDEASKSFFKPPLPPAATCPPPSSHPLYSSIFAINRKNIASRNQPQPNRPPPPPHVRPRPRPAQVAGVFCPRHLPAVALLPQRRSPPLPHHAADRPLNDVRQQVRASRAQPCATRHFLTPAPRSCSADVSSNPALAAGEQPPCAAALALTLTLKPKIRLEPV
jgi:hypothetical protein